MPDDQPGHIEGTFTRAGTQTPIPDVHVTLHGGNSTFQATASTDENGYFVFKGLPTGRYILHSHRNGYLRIRSVHVKLTAEQRIHALNLFLDPAATIRGRILGSNDHPVRRRVVEFLRLRTDQQGRTSWQSCAGAPTNNNGEYGIFTLDPGEYCIRLSAMTDREVESEVSPEDATVAYFPGTTVASAAKPIAVGPGTEAIADFTIPAAKSYRISGKVITALPDAEQLFGLSVGLVSREAEGPVERYPVPVNTLDLPKRSNGSFELHGVRAGSYDLIVRSHTPNADYFSKIPIEVRDRDVKDVVVTLRGGTEVRGRLVIEGRQDSSLRFAPGPLATMPPLSETVGFIYASARSHGRGEISLQLSRKDGIHGGRYSLGPLVDESGTSFTFPNVPEGTYTISARGGPLMFFGSDNYLADIRVGGRSVFDDGAFVVGTDPVDTLEIVVCTNGGSVQGTVSDKQNQKVQLLLIPDPPRRNNPALSALITLTEKSRGEFTLRGIAPGDYKLLAISGADRSIPFLSEDFLAKYESHMTAIRIRDGVRVSVQVPLI